MRMSMKTDKQDVYDMPVQCWQAYRAYLQGCVLYKHEVDVIRHVLVDIGGSIAGFAGMCKEWGTVKMLDRMLQMLQWGVRLWRQMAYNTAIDTLNPLTGQLTREVRQEFLKSFPLAQKLGRATQLIQDTFFAPKQSKDVVAGLWRRPEFWKEVLALYDAVFVAKDSMDELPMSKIEVACAYLAAGKAQDDLPAGTLSIKKRIVPAMHVLRPVQEDDAKHGDRDFGSWEEFMKYMYDIAKRRFIQPICLLAHTMYPPINAQAVVRSPIDSKLYSWDKVPLVDKQSSVAAALSRDLRNSAVRLVTRHSAAEGVKWKDECKKLDEADLPLSSLCMIADGFDIVKEEAAKKEAKKKKKSSSKPTGECMCCVWANITVVYSQIRRSKLLLNT